MGATARQLRERLREARGPGLHQEVLHDREENPRQLRDRPSLWRQVRVHELRSHSGLADGQLPHAKEVSTDGRGREALRQDGLPGVCRSALRVLPREKGLPVLRAGAKTEDPPGGLLLRPRGHYYRHMERRGRAGDQDRGRKMRLQRRRRLTRVASFGGTCRGGGRFARVRRFVCRMTPRALLLAAGRRRGSLYQTSARGLQTRAAKAKHRELATYLLVLIKIRRDSVKRTTKSRNTF